MRPSLSSQLVTLQPERLLARSVIVLCLVQLLTPVQRAALLAGWLATVSLSRGSTWEASRH